MAYFEQTSQFATVANNSQGVCLDDDYIYVSEASELMKYTHDGVFVARHDCTGDSINNHLGDCMIKDGIIYVTSSDYPSTPYNEIVLLYNASDLSFTGTKYDLFSDHVGEGIDYKDGYFWTISDNYDTVYRWQPGFTNPSSFNLTKPEITGSIHHYQTLVWVGDYMYTQVHGGPDPAFPETVLRYYWTGSRFIFVEQMDRVERVLDGQGMAWNFNTHEMLFARRDNAGDGVDRIVTARVRGRIPAFTSKYPIDRIVLEDEITIVNDGDTGTSYEISKIVTDNVANPYGRACLVRGKWSIDGGSNWQALESQPVYLFTLNSEAGDPGHPFSVQLKGLDSAISIGCDEDNVYFRTANGRHGTVTGTATPTYTPTSRTFRIQYELYERE